MYLDIKFYNFEKNNNSCSLHNGVNMYDLSKNQYSSYSAVQNGKVIVGAYIRIYKYDKGLINIFFIFI